MKLGIVGSGMIVNTFLEIKENLNNIEIYAICGTERSRKKMENMGIPKVFTEYSEMLKTDIDTVYVALPNHLHYDYIKIALEKGKNVIAEKPIASNYNEAKELFDLAEDKKLFLFEAITTIHLPNYKEIKNMLPKLGDIKLVECNYLQYSSRYDKFKDGEITPVFNREMSGGALMDINLYNFYFVIGLFGAPNNVTYYPNIEKEVDTSGMAVLEYDCFKAVCTGAKDCEAAPYSVICGTKGNITMESAPNTCEKFTLNLDNSLSFNSNPYKHRMVDEFIMFEYYIRNKDYNAFKNLAKLSLDVSNAMTKARKSANYLFPADKKYLD